MGNIVCLIGRLVRNPELKHTANTGNAMARFTIAVDRNLTKEKRNELIKKNAQTADFIGCVAWGKTAETIEKYFSKGSQIAVQGRIQTGSYEKNGARIYTTDVAVDRFEFISSKQNNSSGGGMSNPNDFGLGDDAFEVNDDIPF